MRTNVSYSRELRNTLPEYFEMFLIFLIRLYSMMLQVVEKVTILIFLRRKKETLRNIGRAHCPYKR